VLNHLLLQLPDVLLNLLAAAQQHADWGSPCESSDLVLLSLSCGVCCICRWPDVLSNLLAAADWGSPFAPQFKLRALRSLKHIFKGLMTKRFVAEPLIQPAGSSAALGEFCICLRCFSLVFQVSQPALLYCY
jgi:hypothetical protein